MGIDTRQAKREAERMIKEAMANMEQHIIRCLARLGEECIREARDRSPEESWIDQTGNLRSSIGYIILKQGREISIGGFTKQIKVVKLKRKGKGGRTEKEVDVGYNGTITGKRFARELSSKYPKGFTLVVVAGMSYAVYVEALENKNVLASSELYARQRAPILLKDLYKQR